MILLTIVKTLFKLLNIFAYIYTFFFFFYLHSKFFITNRPGWRYTSQDKLDNAIPKKSKILSGITEQRFILIHKISTVGSGDFPGTLISMQWLSLPVSRMIHFIIATLSAAIICLLPQWVKRAITAMKHLGLGVAHSTSTCSQLARGSRMAARTRCDPPTHSEGAENQIQVSSGSLQHGRIQWY